MKNEIIEALNSLYYRDEISNETLNEALDYLDQEYDSLIKQFSNLSAEEFADVILSFS